MRGRGELGITAAAVPSTGHADLRPASTKILSSTSLSRHTPTFPRNMHDLIRAGLAAAIVTTAASPFSADQW